MAAVGGGETFSPSDGRSISTGQNDDWYYLKFQTINNVDYLGISKNQRGDIGFTRNGEFSGRIIPILAGQHPGNSEWYVCPLRNVESVTNVDIGTDYLSFTGNGNFTCYQWTDLGNTVNAVIDLHELRLVASSNGNVVDTKLTVNATVTNFAPADTGFGFFFVPTNAADFRYVNIGGTNYDLQGAEGSVPIDKVIEFMDGSGLPVSNTWDWNDMPAGTGSYAEIVTIGGNKGLFYGTYGYGATNEYFIDPIFSVDYSPNPAEWLVNGSLTTGNDTSFQSQIDITTNISDSLDSTNYTIGSGSNIITYTFWSEKDENQTDKTITQDGTYIEVNHDYPTKHATLNLTSAVYNGSQLNLYIKSANAIHKTLYITDNGWTKDYATIYLGNDTSSYYWYNITLANLDSTGDTELWLHDDGASGGFKAHYDFIEVIAPSSEGTGITAKWDQTYDPAYDWFLRIRKVSSNTASLTTAAYDTEDTISSETTSMSINNIGWFNIPIDDLMDYMTNNQSLNYTQLRFWTELDSDIAEVQLRKEANDTTIPVISNCLINTTSVGEDEEVLMNCTVTDNLDVASVTGQVTGTNYSFAQQLNDEWSYAWHCTQEGSFTWEQVWASDIVNLNDTYIPNLNWTCTLTPPPGVADLTSPSQTNNSIYSTWTNPGGDWSLTEIWIDNVNVLNTTDDSYNATGFGEGESHNITLYTVDAYGARNNTGSSDTQTTLVSDATPPATITGIGSPSQTANSVFWNWTNPVDADLHHIEISIDGIWEINVSVNYYNATGLAEDTSYTISTRTVDNNGNINTTWVNHTQATLDVTPPPAIDINSFLSPYQGTTWIYWNWTNTGNYTELWLNGTNVLNTSYPFYNATGLSADTYYTLALRSVDDAGNLNATWTNNTNTTLDDVPPSVTFLNLTPNPAEFLVESIFINASVTDDDNETSIYWLAIQYPENGSFIQNSTNITNITLTPAQLNVTGNYIITLYAKDQSGNTNTSILTLVVQDSIAPNATLNVTPQLLEHEVDSTNIFGNVTDLAPLTYWITVNNPDTTLLYNTSVLNFTLGPDNLSQEGNYSVQFYYTDDTNPGTLNSYFVVCDPSWTLLVTAWTGCINDSKSRLFYRMDANSCGLVNPYANTTELGACGGGGGGGPTMPSLNVTKPVFLPTGNIVLIPEERPVFFLGEAFSLTVSKALIWEIFILAIANILLFRYLLKYRRNKRRAYRG